MDPNCSEDCAHRHGETGPLPCHAPFLEVVLENTDTLLAHLDPQLNFLLVNSAYLRACGLSREELLGRNYFELFPDPGQRCLFESVRDTGEEARFQAAPFNFSPRRTAPGEETFWNWTLSPVKDPEGRVTSLVHSLTEVTAQVRYLEERRRAAEELRAANTRKDDFLALLAHELRTPLSPLTSAARMLKRGLTGPPFEEALQVIDRQVWHMVRLIDDLLDVSRIGRGTLRLHKQPVPLDMIIESALSTCRPLMEERDHRLSLTLPDVPLLIRADATRLTQVILNLLQNAARYTPAGGQVRVSLEEEAEQAVIRVEDTGIGLSQEAIPRLFEMFAQIQSTVRPLHRRSSHREPPGNRGPPGGNQRAALRAGRTRRARR